MNDKVTPTKKTVLTPQRAPAFTITTSAQRDKERYLNLLVYGGYGVGKTTLAGSCMDVAQMGDVLMIDAESGDLSLDDYENLDVVTINAYKQIARVQEYLKKHCAARDSDNIDELRRMEAILKGVDESEIETPRKYRTVIIDSLTEVETYCMYQLLSITDSTRIDDEAQSAEWTEYKKNHQMIQRLVRNFRDLPMNLIITCAQSYNQDETKKYKYAPQLTGKLATQVQGFMDMVGYLVVGAAKDDGPLPRRLYVQPSSQGRYDAKNRFARYQKAWFDDPSIEMILDEVGLLRKS